MNTLIAKNEQNWTQKQKKPNNFKQNNICSHIEQKNQEGELKKFFAGV